MKTAGSLFIVLFILVANPAIAQSMSPSYGQPMVHASGELNQASLNSNQVIKWSSYAIMDAYTFDFRTLDQVLQNLHANFSDKGYQEFKTALESSNLSSQVLTKKLGVAAVLDGSVNIVKEGVENNVYTWSVEVPVVLYLRGPYDMTKQKKVATITVKRAALSDYSNGLVIDSFTTKDIR